MPLPAELGLEHCLLTEAEASDLVAGSELRQPGGRVMDPKAQLFGTFAANVRPPDVIPTPEEARAQLRKLVELLDDPAPALAHVRDVTVPGAAGPVPARVYCDRPPAAGDAPPMLLYLHGGGWVQGDLETHHGACARLAAWSGVMVVALHYRLAPEHPFPAGADDCLAAYRWLRRHGGELGGDPTRVAVGGDSAGGNLAAVVCQDAMAAGDEPPPDFAVLVYPAVDLGWRSASHAQMPDAFILPRNRLDWYNEQYIASPEQIDDPRVSPIAGTDLRGHPPALVVTAGFDPLRDEGRHYADRLAEAGCDVVYHEYPGQIHIFFSVTRALPAGLVCQREVAGYMRERFGIGRQ